MIDDPKLFAVVDPRTFDGDAYEVAERACLQAQAIARILNRCIETAEIMARNAEMDRSPNPDAISWPESAQGQKFKAALDESEDLIKRLGILSKAAGYNPRG